MNASDDFIRTNSHTRDVPRTTTQLGLIHHHQVAVECVLSCRHCLAPHRFVGYSRLVGLAPIAVGRPQPGLPSSGPRGTAHH